MMQPIEYVAAQAGFTAHRVNVAVRGAEKSYRYYLRDADGELAADGRSFDDAELREYLEAHHD